MRSYSIEEIKEMPIGTLAYADGHLVLLDANGRLIKRDINLPKNKFIVTQPVYFESALPTDGWVVLHKEDKWTSFRKSKTDVKQGDFVTFENLKYLPPYSLVYSVEQGVHCIKMSRDGIWPFSVAFNMSFNGGLEIQADIVSAEFKPTDEFLAIYVPHRPLYPEKTDEIEKLAEDLRKNDKPALAERLSKLVEEYKNEFDLH